MAYPFSKTLTKDIGIYDGTGNLDDNTFTVNGEKFAFVSDASVLGKDNKDINYIVTAHNATNLDTTDAAAMAKLINQKTGIAAAASATAIDAAIKKVSVSRGKMGAVQNRLEHTINNLDTASENLQTAESRIRDTDMAEEMVNYSKNNILAQAGQSMLAQVNQSNQGVLTLLQ